MIIYSNIAGNCHQHRFSPKDDEKFHWSVVNPDFQFTNGKGIHSHSLVTVQTPNVHNEYVLLIGGRNEDFQILDQGFMSRSIRISPRCSRVSLLKIKLSNSMEPGLLLVT